MGILSDIKLFLNSTALTANPTPLDKLITQQIQVTGGGLKRFMFLENTTFTVPAGVTKIYVTACGGGGGGGCYVGSSPCTGGGGAAACWQKPFAVIPGQDIVLTIGEGGTGAAVGTSGIQLQALNGTATVVGELITLLGGGRGSTGESGGGLPGGGGGGYGGASPSSSSDSGASQDGIFGRGGCTTTTNAPSATDGGTLWESRRQLPKAGHMGGFGGGGGSSGIGSSSEFPGGGGSLGGGGAGTDYSGSRIVCYGGRGGKGVVIIEY